MSKKLIFLLFLGLLVRMIFIPVPGFEGDVTFWKSWSLATYDKGIIWLTENTTYNYPAGFTLILWLMGKVYSLLADPHNLQQYWQAGNYLSLLLIKLPSILADLGIAYLIYQLFSRQAKQLDLPVSEKFAQKLALPLAALYLFHPVVLYDGVWWGQLDSLGTVFTLLCFYLLVKKQPLWASVAITTGFLLKMQNIIFLPLFFLYLWLAFSRQKMVEALAAALATYLLITLPFSLTGHLSRTFTLITSNFDWFPLISLNAYNLWWIVSGGHGFTISDKIPIYGLTSAKTLGMLFFAAVYWLATILIVRQPKPKNLLLAFTLVTATFFLLVTQSHERYLFPALTLVIILLPFLAKKDHLSWPIWLLFAIFSLTCLINLNNVLTYFYPQNGLPGGQIFALPIVGLIISYFNLFLFALLLFATSRSLPKAIWLGVPVIIFGGLLLSNFKYLTSNSISLTQLSPYMSEQQFSSLQVNRNLVSANGWKNWGFLSANYYFYRHGLATQANSRIVYNLNSHFKRFATDMGIDADGGQEASVVFEIYGDNKLLYRSGVVRKFDLPSRTEVSIAGVKNLALVVNDAGNGPKDDHADWLEPTLYK